MPIRPRRCNRQPRRNSSALPVRGRDLVGRQLAAIEGQEDLFQARLVTREIRDLAVSQCAHQRLEAAAHDAANPPILNLEPVDARRPKGFHRNRATEVDLDFIEPDVVQLTEYGGPNQATVADDPDPVADMLDLRE